MFRCVIAVAFITYGCALLQRKIVHLQSTQACSIPADISKLSNLLHVEELELKLEKQLIPAEMRFSIVPDDLTV